jgi:signal transduction histidine kinase
MQVVSNLVGNAVQAGGGAGRIEVSLRREGAGSVVLRVVDEGPGMDEETRRRALEPFFSTKTLTGGTGLGLSMVHGIVEGWGGALEINSSPGLGTEIVMRLPATGCLPQDQRLLGADRLIEGSGTRKNARDLERVADEPGSGGR